MLSCCFVCIQENCFEPTLSWIPRQNIICKYLQIGMNEVCQNKSWNLSNWSHYCLENTSFTNKLFWYFLNKAKVQWLRPENLHAFISAENKLTISSAVYIWNHRYLIHVKAVSCSIADRALQQSKHPAALFTSDGREKRKIAMHGLVKQTQFSVSLSLCGPKEDFKHRTTKASWKREETLRICQLYIGLSHHPWSWIWCNDWNDTNPSASGRDRIFAKSSRDSTLTQSAQLWNLKCRRFSEQRFLSCDDSDHGIRTSEEKSAKPAACNPGKAA